MLYLIFYENIFTVIQFMGCYFSTNNEPTQVETTMFDFNPLRFS